MNQKQVDAKKMEQDWERRDRLYQEQLEAYVAMAKAVECEVCSVHGRVVVLLGGRSAALCNTHVNAWTEFFCDHELSGKYSDAQADYQVATGYGGEVYIGNKLDGHDARKLGRVRMALAVATYTLSGEWLKEEKWVAVIP